LNNKVVLEIKSLKKNFGGIKAVDDVSMKLHKNEILAIVGDNGAGKSTLIKIITGVYKKDSGEICINGEKVEINNTRDARHLGIETVYQDKGLIPVLDTPSNLFLGREVFQKNILGKLFKFLDYRFMREEAKKLLKLFGIKLKNIHADVSVLSGGQQQSIVVGRAIYWSGKIIIFDEPTNNLGVKEQHKTIALIRRVRDKYNVSIILITHNLYHVFELVDRIIVLRNGKIIGEKMRDKTTQLEIVSMITGSSR